VAHTCNPSYSGGKDRENHGSKPAQANISTRSYLEKNPSEKKKGCWSGQGVGAEFNPQYHKKKKKERKKINWTLKLRLESNLQNTKPLELEGEARGGSWIYCLTAKREP
jgi:hypothetical protein